MFIFYVCQQLVLFTGHASVLHVKAAVTISLIAQANMSDEHPNRDEPMTLQLMRKLMYTISFLEDL